MAGLFKEGHPGGPGRPKGSKDEKWKSLQALWDELMKVLPECDKHKQADILAKMIGYHIERVLAGISKSPQESVANAEQIYRERMKTLGIPEADKKAQQ